MLDFDGIKPGESLACFIDRVINPDTEYLAQCGKTINGVADVLKSQLFNYRVMRVIKGGSLGKGTAVRGRSDADLLFPIYDITSIRDLKTRLAYILQDIQSALQRSGYNIRNVNQTPFTIQFEILIDNIWQSVDALPIANLANDPSNPTRAELSAIYEGMRRDPELRDYYHKCINPVQVEFVGQQQEKVKRVIRALKYWIKTKKHELTSFAAELLVIKAYEDLGKPHPGTVSEERIMELVFQMLKNFRNIKIAWTEFYDPRMFDTPSVPYILDPTDPYHNLIRKQKTVDYWTNQAVALESWTTQGVDPSIISLERDAERAYQSFHI